MAEKQKLYMMTTTCRGDITVKESEEGYLKWTNRLNTNIRTKSKREYGTNPAYAAVIERQDRGHLHTHFLTTFVPSDAYYITDHYERYCQDVYNLSPHIPQNMHYTPEKLKDIDHRQMFSTWLALAAVSAGLGVQVRLAVADLIEGASRYIAKYLFKEAQFTQFPKGLKRIRYSRNWPKLPEIEATSAFAVITQADWSRIAYLGQEVECYGKDVFERAANHLITDAFYLDADGNKRGVECL